MTHERIMRVITGQAIPEDWEFVRWIGVETGAEFYPTYKADIILVRRREQQSAASSGEAVTPTLEKAT